MPASVYPATMRRVPPPSLPPDAACIPRRVRNICGRTTHCPRTSGPGAAGIGPWTQLLGIMENRRHGRGKASTAAKKPQAGTCGRAGCCGTASLPPQGGEGKSKRHPAGRRRGSAPLGQGAQRRQNGRWPNADRTPPERRPDANRTLTRRTTRRNRTEAVRAGGRPQCR